VDFRLPSSLAADVGVRHQGDFVAIVLQEVLAGLDESLAGGVEISAVNALSDSPDSHDFGHGRVEVESCCEVPSLDLGIGVPHGVGISNADLNGVLVHGWLLD